jgi:hypothetical protein
MAADATGAGAAAGAGATPPVTAAPTPLKINNGAFTVDRKRYDPLSRPFHRLNARTYDKQVDVGPTPGKVGPSGKGRDCGCRTADDFKSSVLTAAIVGTLIDTLDAAVSKALPGAAAVRAALEKQFGNKTDDLKKKITDFLSNLFERTLFGGFLKFIPAWVPVNRQGFGPSFDAEDAHNVGDDGREAEVEVEGRLSRSYQTHHHRPYTQWSRYYHWAFHVLPSVGFKHLVRKGSLRNKSDNDLENASNQTLQRAIEIYEDGLGLDSRAHLECLLDIGAFSKPPGDTTGKQVLTHPGIFYDKSWPMWPQSGDWFWATGRYVYDCTHATEEKEDGKDIQLYPSLINPVKAFATGRYEAELFDESDEPIPVTRFSFFACRKGGYWDFDGDHIPFGTVNYEFAVDLPPAPGGDVAYDIGAVGDFALNTLLIRPRLLQKIAFAPFSAVDDTIRWHSEPPSIQVVRPTDGSLPRMVKVTVPMDTVPKDVDGYSFTISFGWLAPGAPTGVKKVTVKLAEIRFLQDRSDLRMTFCVNGRMIFFPTTNPPKVFTGPRDSLQGFPDDTGIVLFLPPEKGVRITAFGMQRNGFGKFLETNRLVDPTFNGDESKRTDDRQLAVGGIFNVDKKTEDDLKKLAEKKISDVIPPALLGRFRKIEETLDDDTFRKLLGKAVSDLVGQRRIVVWEKDVDFQESDAAKKDEIACAVAREMSVFPVGLIFNDPNDPKGFVEFQSFDAGTFPGNQASILDVKAMLSRQQSQNSATTTVEFNARPLVQAKDSEFVVSVLNDIDGNVVDYVLKITATIADPDPPK